MIVLDANVLISFWAEGDAHAADAFEILDTEEDLVLHPVTLAETLVWPVREQRESEALEDHARLGVERLTPATDEPLRVARLRAETGLKLPDAYVLAAAIMLGATLATFDRRLADIARERGVEVVGA
ncbi:MULTISPECIES: PIN domain-containing protein [unclassified Microbacterium]|uniref:type II toxin-antitoxin system VapC family toxin n=1 Tax=unclassified Microbacterium TaxID=2609290 RepID=UPI001403510A|nr:PIN domain-containing protein [Microbacterium sp. TPD7012]